MFWLAVAIVLNSALSLFYYLRIGLVMFFEEPESDSPLKSPPSLEWPLSLRSVIMICATLTLLFGIGPMSESLLDLVSSAVDSLLTS